MDNEDRPPSASKSLRREGWQPFVLDGAIMVGIVLVSLWIYSPLEELFFNKYDLGIAAYGGLRVLEGFIPYTEMHIIYGPAQYYLRAFLFYLLDTSIETMELERLIVAISATVAVYWGLRGSIGHVVAVLLALIIGALPTNLTPLVGMFVAVGCMTRYSRHRHAGWLVGLGVSIGIVGAFRWDFGLYSIVVFVMALATLPLVRRVAAPPDEVLASAQVRTRWLLLVLTSALLAALPFYAPALLTDPLAIFRSIGLALSTMGYRTLPWPDVPSLIDLIYGQLTVPQYLYLVSNSFPAYAFFFLCPLNVIVALISLRRGSPVTPSVSLLVHTQVTMLLGAFLVVYANARADLGHTLLSTAFMLFSLPLVLWFGSQSIGRSIGDAPLRVVAPRWGVLALILLILFPTFLLSTRTFLLSIRSLESQNAPQEGLYTAPTLAGLSPLENASPSAQEYNALVDYIKENTTPGEFIFSGNVRHDKIFINDVLIYFASERHAGTRDYHMDPGTTTRQDVQQQIISDLKRNDVRLVVLDNAPLPTEPNKSVESSGITDLDDYIKDNYVFQEQFGQYYVLTKGKPPDSYCSSSSSTEYGYVDVLQPLTEGSGVERDGQVRIGGWAATPAGSPPVERIEVQVEGQGVGPVIECMPREDLAEAFGEDARYGGWEVTADLRDIEVTGPTVDVSAEAIDRDGGRHPLPRSSQAISELRLAP